MDTLSFLTAGECVLVVIDIQGKLSKSVYEADKLLDNLLRMIQGADIMNVPVVLTEQYPQGLGPTVPEVLDLLPGIQPVPKRSFSCWGEQQFVVRLAATDRRQVLLTGIESHVCVYQTAIDLLKAGYGVHAITECISSRTQENRWLGLKRMQEAGARLTGVEMLLFELLKVAEGDNFKAISKIVK